MKKEEKEKSLKRQLTWMLLTAFAVVTVLLVIFDCYSISRSYQQLRQEASQTVEQLVRNTEDAMQNVDNTLSMFYFNSADFETISTKKDGVLSYGAAYNLDTMLQSFLLAKSGFCGYIISYDGGIQLLYKFVEGMEYEEKEQVIQQLKSQLEPLINKNEWMLVQTDKGLYYAKIYQKRYGSIVGLVSLSDYEKTTREIAGMTPQFLVMKGQEAVTRPELAEELELSGQDSQTTGNDIRETGACFVARREIGSSGLSLCMVLQKNWKYYFQLQQILIVVGSVGTLIVLILLMQHLNRKMVGSLTELKDTMERIRDHNLDADISLHSDFAEIEEVNEMFQQMMEQIRFLKIHSYEEKIKKQKAELTYFQLQIRPHFYLNCLKTMNALVSEGKYDKIQNLIFSISVHMRYLLKMEKDMVTLEEEISYAKNYLNLQNDLLEHKAVCCWEIPEQLSGSEVPLLTIQTFFENSFKYYKPRRDGEYLCIGVKALKLSTEEGEYIDLTIWDNGAGYPEEVLAVINGQEVNDQVGVGITNLKNRCAILYDGKAEYNFYNSDGAVSELILPIADSGEAPSEKRNGEMG